MKHTEIEQWGQFEIDIQGEFKGNPFMNTTFRAKFTCGEYTREVKGFYDGGGIFKVRFMPDIIGEWRYEVFSCNGSLFSKDGNFSCIPPTGGNHGPVGIRNTYHFTYADGTPFYPVGTTCYAWTHQETKVQEQTLDTLAGSPFNKLRMCVFPKHYEFNKTEPPCFPYEGSMEKGWDFERFNPAFFRHLEKRILDLQRIGIEADIILFHPYDRWGFSRMTAAQDQRYLEYIITRLSSFRNVWWSLANEFDGLASKTLDDWERIGFTIQRNDPYGHLCSIHNCSQIFDHSRPWITHCSMQRIDPWKPTEDTDTLREKYNKPVIYDEFEYEGNLNFGWGNITGEELVRRAWECVVRGGYITHGETYLNPDGIIWWAMGGKLTGKSPERIAFLKKVIEEGPEGGITPFELNWCDDAKGGEPRKYYLYYYGVRQPAFMTYSMPEGTKYQVDILDTWNMTIDHLPGIYEGSFTIVMPQKPYVAVRMRGLKDYL